MTLIDDIETYMPLRCNRRHTNKLTDFHRGPYNEPQRKQVGRIDVSAATSVYGNRCWQQWITEGRCTVAEGQYVPGTQMIARIVQSDGHFGTNNVASIDSMPLMPSRETINIDD
ncbi:hypothetical protein TNCV_2036411 [Trichonephila clavipes]|nr:hypothetical protein TNCV_2036411 [Trichonephila clavipes]